MNVDPIVARKTESAQSTSLVIDRPQQALNVE